MANGIMVLQAAQLDSAPAEVRVTFMLVFDVVPWDLGGLPANRVKPTPAHAPDGSSLLHPVAEKMLDSSSGEALKARLDDGTSVYEVVQLKLAWPLVIKDARSDATALWEKLYTEGIANRHRDQFEHAGTWVPMTPPA